MPPSPFPSAGKKKSKIPTEDKTETVFNSHQKYIMHQPGLNWCSLVGMCLTPSGNSTRIYKEKGRERAAKSKMPQKMLEYSLKADYKAARLGTSVHATRPNPRKEL